ncbi:MAG TPA: hypothetical protein PLJ38_06600, partial [bacterium]|nr:hypothetical protein [bacterium]
MIRNEIMKYCNIFDIALLINSPGAQYFSATLIIYWPLIFFKPNCSRVVGNPTFLQKPYTSSIAVLFLSVRKSETKVPN